MALDKATIRNRVRAIIGNPPTDDLTDATIEWFIDLAVLEIQEKDEGDQASLGSFETVADQQNYAPADGAGEIIDVYWRGEQRGTSLYSDVYTDANSYLIDHAMPIGDIGWHQRALDLIQEMKVDRWYHTSSRGHYWDLIGGEIYLDPRPTKDGSTVYYLYSKNTSTLANISDEKERGIIWFAAWQSLITVANSRAGAVIFHATSLDGEQRAAEVLLENAVRYREMWMEFLSDMTTRRF